MRIRVLPLLLAVGLLAGCAGGDDDSKPASTPPVSQPTSSDELAGRSFIAYSVDGYELAADTQINLEFGKNTLAASAGCNRTTGKYEIQEYNLHFKPGPSTLMGCPEDLLDQDEWLRDFLESGPSATLDGGSLQLSGAHDMTVTLEDSTDKLPGS